jgi:hypothetical protein
MSRPTLLAEIPAIAATRAAIAHLRAAGEALGLATGMELELQRGKPGEKLAAIRRLMADPGGNGLTGKAHSATSAEAIAETDPEYASFLKRVSLATVQVILARTEYTAARIESQLELALLLAEPDGDHDDAPFT